MKNFQPSSAGSPLLRRALSPDRLHPRSAEGKKVWLLTRVTWVPCFPIQHPPKFSFVLPPKQLHCKLPSQQYWLVFQGGCHIPPVLSPLQVCEWTWGAQDHQAQLYITPSIQVYISILPPKQYFLWQLFNFTKWSSYCFYILDMYNIWTWNISIS